MTEAAGTSAGDQPIRQVPRRALPGYLRRPADPPLPRGRILAGTLAVLVFVIAMYNLTGQALEERMDASAIALCSYISGATCPATTENGFLANGVYMEIDLYWLPGIFSVIALPVFVFPAPVVRALVASVSAALVVAAFWLLQVFGAVALVAAFGWHWPSLLTYGPVAIVMSYMSFICGFVVLLSILLADSEARQLEPRTLPGDPPISAVASTNEVVAANSDVIGEDVGPTQRVEG